MKTAFGFISSPCKHLPALLPVIREMITDSVFSLFRAGYFINRIPNPLAVNLKKCDFVASRPADAYIYGEDHPYGRYTRVADIDD